MDEFQDTVDPDATFDADGKAISKGYTEFSVARACIHVRVFTVMHGHRGHAQHRHTVFAGYKSCNCDMCTLNFYLVSVRLLQA